MDGSEYETQQFLLFRFLYTQFFHGMCHIRGYFPIWCDAKRNVWDMHTRLPDYMQENGRSTSPYPQALGGGYALFPRR